MKKNENYPKYVQAMRLMDSGKMPKTVARELHMDIGTVKLKRKLYLKGGELALLAPEYSPQMTAKKKEKILSLSQNAGKDKTIFVV